MSLDRRLKLADLVEAGAPLDEAQRVLAAAILRGRLSSAAEDRKERDRWILQIRQRYFPTASVKAAADQISREAARYREGEWRHHRARAEVPEVIRKSIRELLWRAFKSHELFPSSRQIENILAGR